VTHYFDIALTPAVLDLQARKGSPVRHTFGGGTDLRTRPRIDQREIEMLTGRDSFYLASVSETGWPYVQHRGGDVGFVKILDDQTIGWSERRGNRQYLGTGNITADGRVAAIFVDYPGRTRLKLFGRATYHADPAPELLARLDALHERVDGVVTVEVLATDWNCPKYITPRFTEEQLRTLADLPPCRRGP
jgi:predicted pyridoxine 5'-phosphate oxidase superfamily flavin-nucleotide-binding protein